MAANSGRELAGVVAALALPACLLAQRPVTADPASHLLSPAEVEALLTRRPACLEGYRTNQTGMLSRSDAPPGVRAESTFTVETLSVPSDGVLIRGWLYLPKRPANARSPAIVLTNGGGDGSRAIKSLSGWIAPVPAHCGIAALEDRIYAHMGGFRSRGIPDSVIAAVEPLWHQSFAAWASDTPADHARVNAEIAEARGRFPRDVLPFPKEEMERIPGFAAVLPTWRSLARDHMTEMARFNRPWLAMFGEVDQVVPTQASVRNIQRLMAQSRSTRYTIAVIPRCGHAPVDVETRRMIRLDNLILNWLTDHVLRG